MGGGKYDYADAYSKYKVGDASDADFEAYVDAKHSSYWKLLDAYNKGEDVDTKFAGQYQHPAGLSPSQQAEYWQKRGATSKAAFGRAHAAEDEALQSGTYHGGTDVKPWEGNTAFEDWLATKGRSDTTTDTTDSNTAPPFYKTGGGSYGDRNYPIGLMDYTELSPLDASYGLPDTYSPWAQPDYIPDSLWNYTPPELVDWDMSNRVPWDWATKDISEYMPVDEATKARVAQQFREGPEGNRDGYNPMNDPANYMPGHELDPAYYTGPDLNWDASASRKNFDWNNPLGAWANKNIYGMEDSNAMAAQIQAMQDIAEDDYMGDVSLDFGIGTGAGLNYDG